MSLFSAKPKSTTAALERDLAELSKRRDKLKAKLDRAVIDAERAAGERRRLMIEVDEPDAGAVAKAEAACRAADEARATIEDALRHAGERILVLEANIAEQADRAERAAAAEELERRALVVDVATGDFRDAVEAVAKRYAGLIEAMRASGQIIASHGMPVVPELVAVMALDAAVRNFEPRLVPREPAAGMPPAPTDCLGVVQRVVSTRLRDMAEAIRKGDAPAALPPMWAQRRAPVRFSDARMLLWTPISYISVHGEAATALAGECDLPEPVAAAVVTQRLGERAGTESAAAWLARHKVELATGGYTGRFTNSGVNLYALANPS